MTHEVQVYRFRFPADRYCEVCREAEKAEVEQQRADVLWSQAHVPFEFQTASFSTFQAAGGTATALAVAQAWAADVRHGNKPRRGLFLYGPPGGGKTHLAVSIVREAIYSRFARCLFLNVPDWLNALRDAWFDSGEAPPNPDGVDLLVIDDLGAENSTEWSRERIYGLINHRTQNRLLTVATSNLEPPELAARLGRASASRLTALCANVEVSSRQDFRAIGMDEKGF